MTMAKHLSHLPALIVSFFLANSLSLAGQIQWSPFGEDLEAEVTPEGVPSARFTRIPSTQSQIRFVNNVAESQHIRNQVLLNGSGLAAGDVNGDDLTDLYYCGLLSDDTLYLNQGDFRFEPIRSPSGGLQSTGAALADIDGDSDLDLIVNTLNQGTHLFLNDGQGAFTKTADTLNPDAAGMSLSLADINGDSFLDLYITNYRLHALMDIPNAKATFKEVDGQTVVDTLDGVSTSEPHLINRFIVAPDGSIREQGQPDRLYLNDQGQGWREVALDHDAFQSSQGQTLATPLYDWGLAAMFHDVDLDGFPDLYVCNDFESPDRLWYGKDWKKFQRIPDMGLRKTSKFSMAVDFSDINRDGLMDFFVLDMLPTSDEERKRMLRERIMSETDPSNRLSRPQYSYNQLQLNRGQRKFSEIAHLAGVEAADWAWCCAFLDADLDGYDDLFIGNGVERAARDIDVIRDLRKKRDEKPLTDAQVFELRRRFPRLRSQNMAYHNNGRLGFTRVGQDWGFADRDITTSMILADLDNDGDQDIAVNNYNSLAAIYRNDCQSPRLQIRLRGAGKNTHAIGAVMTLTSDGQLPQTKEIIAGGRYLGSDQPTRTFATPAPSARYKLSIRWPSGHQSRYHDLKPNRIYALEEPELTSANTSAEVPPAARQLFSPRSFPASAQAAVPSFDDRSRQPTLPFSLSPTGRFTALESPGTKGKPVILLQRQGIALESYRLSDQSQDIMPIANPFEGIQTQRKAVGFVASNNSTDRNSVIVAYSNYADGLSKSPVVVAYDLSETAEQKSLLTAYESAIACLAEGDLNHDGKPDIFVGGGAIPGRYPSPASSQILFGTKGDWVTHAKVDKDLEKVGNVRDAMIIDLDGDGQNELILALHWGPIRVFRYQNEGLLELTETLRLEAYVGLWNCLAIDDINHDGRLDIVAGNWGLNRSLESSTGHPHWTFYLGDWDNNGVTELIETRMDEDGNPRPTAHLNELSKDLPFVQNRFRSNRHYAKQSLDAVLDDYRERFDSVSLTWLATTTFLNNGSYFEAKPLPPIGQISPAQDLVIDDFNGDGNADLAMAQNLFPVKRHQPRQDAGFGQIFLGEKNGSWAPIPLTESGFIHYGQATQMESVDLNGDSMKDLLLLEADGAMTVYFRQDPGALPQRQLLR